MSSQDEREDDDGAAQNLPPTPAPSWIREGVALIVTDGNKNVEYAAHVKSRPFLCDNVWFVTIKYDLSCELADVECSRCNVIDLEGKRPKRFRRTVKQEKCVIEPPEIIDVQSFSSFSFSEVGGDGNEQAVARLPLQEDDSVAFGADFFPAVTPSPTREATSFNIPKKRGLDSLAQVSDELFGADDSDEDSVMNKKPAAREKSTRDYNEADVVEEEDSRQLENAEKFEAAKNVLGNLEYSPKEVEAALHAIGPPYTNLQTAALQIQRQRRLNQNSSVFEVEIGMTFRKPFDGTEYEGVVLSKVNEKVKKGDGRAVNVWKVVYSDGDEEELDYDELLRFRYPRPEVASCLGRPMQGLELFCGRGIVSQEFRQRQWKMESVDFAETSNATIKTDILDLEITKLPFVPDFIWISFDCSTYSKAAGGLHRSAKRGRFEKTSKAKLNNLSFLKTVRICKWARSLHPHVIIAIENPVGQLQCMPLMKQFEEDFGLYKQVVDYCCFGRSEKKPTFIWSNELALCENLSVYRCKNRCQLPPGMAHQPVQGNSATIDFGAIPQPLAYEVAAYVDAKFTLDRIRRREAKDPASGHPLAEQDMTSYETLALDCATSDEEEEEAEE